MGARKLAERFSLLKGRIVNLVPVPGLLPATKDLRPAVKARVDAVYQPLDRLGCGTIASAVVRRAKMRSTFQHPPRNTYFRFAGIDARLSLAASGILGNAA